MYFKDLSTISLYVSFVTFFSFSPLPFSLGKKKKHATSYQNFFLLFKGIIFSIIINLASHIGNSKN